MHRYLCTHPSLTNGHQSDHLSCALTVRLDYRKLARRQEEESGLTALHYACRKGESMALAVLSLIDAGADAAAVRAAAARLPRQAAVVGSLDK